MKTHAKKFGIAVLVLACFSFADQTFAATVYSQPTFNNTTRNFASTSPSTPWLTQELGTGLTGVVTSLSIWSIKTAGAGVIDGAQFTISFAECATTNCSTGSTWAENHDIDIDAQAVGTAYENNVTFTSSRSLNPNKYYILSVTAKSGENFTDNNALFEGSTNAGDWSGGACSTPFGSTGNACSPISDIKFYLYGSQTAVQSSYTTNLSPIMGSTTATTLVHFSFDYVAATSHNITEYRISIHDLTQNQDIVIDDAASSGSHSVSRDIALTSGHTYSWRAWLADASGGLYTGSENPRFSVVSGSFSIGTSFTDLNGSSTFQTLPLPTITEINAGDDGTKADQITQSFLNIPAMMSNMFPFSWMYEIGQMIKSSTSATTSVPTYSIDFSNASTTGEYGILDGLGSVNIISEDIVETFITYDEWQTLRYLIAALMWVGFAYWFMGRVSSVTI